MWLVFQQKYFSRCEILRSQQFLLPMVIIQMAKAEEGEKRRKEYILIRFLYCTISFKWGGGRVETSGRVTIRVTAWCSTMWVVTPCFRKPPGPRKPEWLGPTESWACLTFLYDMWTPSQYLKWAKMRGLQWKVFFAKLSGDLFNCTPTYCLLLHAWYDHHQGWTFWLNSSRSVASVTKILQTWKVILQMTQILTSIIMKMYYEDLLGKLHS